jgi:choline-sulfatase/uncharacterized sulfatase
MGQPNILFILADQHNAKVLGHKGHPNVKTPHLDRMAQEGVSFDRAIVQNPICTPSRICYTSGQYAHNHGYYGLSGPNPNGLPTVFGHFRRHGYTTAAMGKIHCPENWIEDDCDIFHETVADCSIGGQSPEYAAFLKERGKLELEDHGAMNGPDGAKHEQSMDSNPSPLTFEESQEGWVADKAIEIMKQAQADGKPFFIETSLPRPHQCTAPSVPFWQWYDGEALQLPPNADYDMEGKAPNLRRSAAGWRNDDWAVFEPKTFSAARLRKLQGYLGAVSQVDAATGRMLDAIRELGIEENTIVVYTSDHGDYACEHGIMEKAPGISSDAITRVPLIWWAPGRFEGGTVVKQIVESVDFSTTVCALAGLPPMLTSDGKDITPYLNGDESEELHSIGVTEFAWSKSVRKGKYRYIHYPRQFFREEHPNGFCELYDVETDPWEMTNLALDPAYARTISELRTELLDWIISTTRPKTIGLQAKLDDLIEMDPTQFGHAYNNNFLADGKVHPDWIEKTNAWCSNYS